MFKDENLFNFFFIMENIFKKLSLQDLLDSLFPTLQPHCNLENFLIEKIYSMITPLLWWDANDMWIDVKLVETMSIFLLSTDVCPFLSAWIHCLTPYVGLSPEPWHWFIESAFGQRRSWGPTLHCGQGGAQYYRVTRVRTNIALYSFSFYESPSRFG